MSIVHIPNFTLIFLILLTNISRLTRGLFGFVRMYSRLFFFSLVDVRFFPVVVFGSAATSSSSTSAFRLPLSLRAVEFDDGGAASSTGILAGCRVERRGLEDCEFSPISSQPSIMIKVLQRYFSTALKEVMEREWDYGSTYEPSCFLYWCYNNLPTAFIPPFPPAHCCLRYQCQYSPWFWLYWKYAFCIRILRVYYDHMSSVIYDLGIR